MSTNWFSIAVIIMACCCTCFSASQSLHHEVSAAAMRTSTSKQSALPPSQPKSLDFYMYIAVQNNSNVGSMVTFTAVQSAQPIAAQPYAFGSIHTFDNPLHAAASLNSAQLGRVQGWYGNVGQDILTLFLVQTFTFSSSPAGSFSLMGVDVASDTIKYGSIVGGTGDFAYARGVAKQTLVSTQVVDHQTISWFHYAIDFKF